MESHHLYIHSPWHHPSLRHPQQRLITSSVFSLPGERLEFANMVEKELEAETHLRR